MLEIELKMEADQEDREAISKELDPELDKFNEFMQKELRQQPLAQFERAIIKTFLFHKARGHF